MPVPTEQKPTQGLVDIQNRVSTGQINFGELGLPGTRIESMGLNQPEISPESPVPVGSEAVQTLLPGAKKPESPDQSLNVTEPIPDTHSEDLRPHGLARRTTAAVLASLALGGAGMLQAAKVDKAVAAPAPAQVFIGDGDQHVIAWDDARAAGYQVISNTRPSPSALPDQRQWVPRFSGFWEYGKQPGQPPKSDFVQGQILAGEVHSALTVGRDGTPHAPEIAIDELKGKTKVKMLSFIEAIRTQHPEDAKKITLYVANGAYVNLNNYRVGTKNWPGPTTKSERKNGISVVNRALRAGINIGYEVYADFDKQYFNPRFRGNTKVQDAWMANFIDGKPRVVRANGEVFRFGAKTRGDWLGRQRKALKSRSQIKYTVSNIDRFSNSKSSFQAMDRMLYVLHNKTSYKKYHRPNDNLVVWKSSTNPNHIKNAKNASSRDKEYVRLITRYDTNNARTPRWSAVAPTSAQARRIQIYNQHHPIAKKTRR